MVGGLFLLPGVVMLFWHGPAVAVQQSFRYMRSGVLIISEHGAHIFGALGVLVGLIFVWFYFYLRREIARDLDKPKWR